MKKLIFLFLAGTLFCCNAFSQTKTDLDKLPEKERKEYLIKLAKEAVMEHGPDYYRNVKPPVITRHTMTMDRSDFPDYYAKPYLNRGFYIVDYPYDKTKETFCDDYSARTYIWEDTGLVFSTMFGNGLGYADMDKPKTRSSGSDKPDVMPFRSSPPIKE